MLHTAVQCGNLNMVKWLRSDEAAGPEGRVCPAGPIVERELERCSDAELVEWLRADMAARGY